MSPHPFHPNDHDDLLLPCEVARLFRVDPKTVTRWAKQGHLRSISTLGGHRRYYRSDIEALLTTDPTAPPADPPATHQPAHSQPSQSPGSAGPAERAEPGSAGPGRGEPMPRPCPPAASPSPAGAGVSSPPGTGTGVSGGSGSSDVWVASADGVRGRVMRGEGDGGDASVVESR